MERGGRLEGAERVNWAEEIFSIYQMYGKALLAGVNCIEQKPSL